MTDSDHTEGVDTTDESNQDSEVLNTVRKRNRELEKELKSRPTREELEAEIRTELGREKALGEQLVALGHPAGMSAILKEKLKGEDITLAEGQRAHPKVIEALQGVGYQVEVPDAAPESSSEPSQESDLAKVQSLSASVRSAASGADLTDSVAKKIAAAKTPAELAETMREAGLTASYT